MSENILVVEYEPRYTDRVRQALQGQPFTMTFARDGEEAIKALDGDSPRLIVLSSVVPKVSTTELIRAIRGRKPLQETPILLTVSGYNGKSPKADAQRVGASDILPKPYSETEFLGKIQQMLGIRGEGASAAPQFTSNDIFGDMLDDEKPVVKKTTASKSSGDVDKMLADTLAGMMPSRRPAAPAASPTPAPAAAKPKTSPGSSELDKRFQDTLSGLEKTARKNPPARPAGEAAGAAQSDTAEKRFNTEKMQAYVPDRVPVAQPVFPQAAPPPPAPIVPPAPTLTSTPTPMPTPKVETRVEEDEPVDGTKFGQYVLIEKIATGGMAEVWKARMRGVEGFQKIVAIKKILPHLSDNQDFIEMFVDEAKLAAQLNHNNIIHIYDLGKIQSSYYIAMEYIDGFDLKTILRQGQERDNPMQVELALFIASKIASALDYAHRKKDFEEKEMGLVHRDVSPQNVLISQEGDIKLCDFGIAKAASKASHTQAGALKGKLQYMSPEQAWGKSIDRRSDIFALATVLFELLTNRKMFTGDNEISILEQVREARVQPPSLYNDEVTPEVDRIVIKALQKDPANRYQTAGEMARDLDAVLYSFRPTPTSADLAIYMHRLSTPDPVMSDLDHDETLLDEPVPQRNVIAPAPMAPVPVAAAAAAMAAPAIAPPMPIQAAPAPAAEAAAYGEEPVKRKSPVVPIIIVALLLAIGGAAFMLTRGKEPAAQAAQPAVTNTIASANTTAAPAASLTTAPLSTTATTPLTATSAPIDPSLVDAEVQKRINAERARLEALARAQQQTAATATAAPPRATPAPAPAVIAQQTPPPVAPPVQQPETRPAPAPAQETPAPAPPAAAAAETQPAVQRAREGDLVPAGTEGLAAPRLLRRGSVPYPPMARMQKVEGTVITSVLVGERGQVLEVRILRGVSRPVGLNEAAEQTMRRSTFSPPTKDGVRVRSWVTVPVEFKL
jgi:TonB family protein